MSFEDAFTADNDEAVILGFQAGINSGEVWKMEGSIGRQAMSLISDGLCILGTERRHDFWGNLIPARTDVKVGTKGSVEYAEAKHGAAWVKRLVEVK